MIFKLKVREYKARREADAWMKSASRADYKDLPEWRFGYYCGSDDVYWGNIFFYVPVIAFLFGWLSIYI